MVDLVAYRKKLEDRAAANRLAFAGEYKDEIQGLLGLSKEEIDKMTPGTTDLETYSRLISVVKEASAANVAQAELKDNIKQLGELAVSIAKKVPRLATLFA